MKVILRLPFDLAIGVVPRGVYFLLVKKNEQSLLQISLSSTSAIRQLLFLFLSLYCFSFYFLTRYSTLFYKTTNNCETKI